MKDMVTLAITLTIAVLALAPLVTAEVPQMINYQGRLTDSTGAPVPDGNYSVTFCIYDDSTNGNVLWQEGQLVTVQDGLFSIILGGVWPVLDSVFSDTGRWLGVQVGLDPKLSPRSKLVSVGYAFKAGHADSAGHSLDKTVDASELVTGTLDTQRYSAYDDLLSEDKVGDGSGQVAEGDHTHTINGVGMLLEDTSSVEINVHINDGEVFLKSLTIPASTVHDFFRLTTAFGAQQTVGQQGTWEVIIKINGQVIDTYQRAQGLGANVVYTLTGIRLIAQDQWMVGRNNIQFGNQDGLWDVTIDFEQDVTVNVYGRTVSGAGDQNFIFRVFRSVLEF